MIDLQSLSFPASVEKVIHGRAYAQNTVGMSDSVVLMFDDMVLKVQEPNIETEQEIAILQWIGEQDAQMTSLFPKILAYEIQDGRAFTLMTRVQGEMLASRKIKQNPKLLVHLAAEGLKTLWKMDITECPCSESRLENRLKNLRIRAEQGKLSAENAETGTYGKDGFKDPMALLEWLESHQPQEDLVMTHGDYCLPNVMTEEGKLRGFVDLGKAGPADRWQDIALCLRSLQQNFYGKYSGGIEYSGYHPQMLLDELGITMDEEKYRYYLLLDEVE